MEDPSESHNTYDGDAIDADALLKIVSRDSANTGTSIPRLAVERKHQPTMTATTNLNDVDAKGKTNGKRANLNDDNDNTEASDACVLDLLVASGAIATNSTAGAIAVAGGGTDKALGKISGEEPAPTETTTGGGGVARALLLVDKEDYLEIGAGTGTTAVDVDPPALRRQQRYQRASDRTMPGAVAVGSSRGMELNLEESSVIIEGDSEAALTSVPNPESALDPVAIAIEETERNEDLPVAEHLMEPRESGTRPKAFLSSSKMGILLLLLVAAVILGLVFGVTGKTNNMDSTSEPESPSGNMNEEITLALYPEDYVLSLLPIGSMEVIQMDEFSPQRQAYDWVLADPNLFNYTDNRIIQRFALSTLFLSTGGTIDTNTSTWLKQEHWLSYDVHECDWWSYGEFDENGHYVVPEGEAPCVKQNEESTSTNNDYGPYLHLLLPENGLRGTVPPELYHLTTLKSIALLDQLEGSIPSSIGELTNLEAFVYVAGGTTEGTIPTEFGLLTNMSFLGIIFTAVTGTIPTQLGLLTDMEVLVLDYNSYLTGTVPTEIGELTDVHTLYLEYDSSLWGTIPSEFGRLKKVTELYLYASNFYGTIPTELGLMEGVELCDFTINNLSGTIPSELGQLSSVLQLDLSVNNLSGTIPTELGVLSTLWWLELYSNQLEGTIPTEFGQLESLQDMEGFLDNLVATNQALPTFILSFPEAAQRHKDRAGILLHDNHLSGTIPTELGLLSSMINLDLSDNEIIHAMVPSQLMNITSLENFNVSGTSVSGTMPAQLCSTENLTVSFDCLAAEGKNVTNTSGVCGCDCPCEEGVTTEELNM